MGSSIDLISFVMRAENRVDVLLTLASEPGTRPDIQDETGIPRATISRILTDFRDSGLVERNGHLYRTTPLGDLIATELESLCASVESTRALQTLAGWLPLDDLGVDFDRLATAKVTLPTPFDPMSPVKRAARVVENATHVRTFCYSMVHAPILAALRGVAEKGQRLEGIVAAGVLDVVKDDTELAKAAGELFASGDVELYVYSEGIEPQLVIADDRTLFLVTDTEGAIQGLVETDDEAIMPWAEGMFESLKRNADPLSSDEAIEVLAS